MTVLPSPNALRAFEAVSRHLSVNAAAAELFVTAGAISQHIKNLEQMLNTTLFYHANRRIHLTPIGEAYARKLQAAFDLMRSATEDIIHQTTNQLSISVEPAFAMYWLLPRMAKFKQANPDIELHIDASLTLSNLAQNENDVAIRWGKGHYEKLFSHLLVRNEFYPICSPDYLKQHTLKKPADLKKCTLLEEQYSLSVEDFPHWNNWLEHTQQDPSLFKHRISFETGLVLIQAALDGVGVALERELFIKDLVAQKKLIRLFNIDCSEKNSGYYFVCKPERQTEDKVKRFFDWLLGEI